MEKVRQITELAHSARAQSGIKVRQPLAQLVVCCPELRTELLDILKSETNVQAVYFRTELPKSADWQLAEAGSLGIALDMTITEELYYKGFIRELIRQINSLRKKAGLTINDRVNLVFGAADEKVRLSVEQQADWLKQDTLSEEIEFTDMSAGDLEYAVKIRHDKLSALVGIKKI